MDQTEETLTQQKYVPAVAITQITTKHSLGRVMIALANAPERICGVARRIGYTGKRDSDLAIYRLKVKRDSEDNVVTLPCLFVVDGGTFVDYEQWRQKQEAH